MSEAEWVGLEDVPSIADERAMSEHESRQNGNGPETEEDSWLPLNLADLDDEPPVRPSLGDLGLVYPGKRHVFSGPQESAKTLAAYVIGLQVVRTGQKVVLIDFEMGRWDAKARLRELGATVAELAELLYIEPDVRADEAVIERLVEQTPGLVIIDAIAGAFDLHELDDNKRQDVEKFARIWLQPFRRAGIATIVLDHVTKNAETRGKYAIGSERKVGGADVHLGFEVVTPIKRGGHGLYKIVTHKDRGGFLKRGKLAEFELSSDPETHLIQWAFKAPVETDEEHPFRPTTLMEKVSRFLERQYEDVKWDDVEKAIGGKAEYVRTARDLLLEEGYIDDVRGAHNARLTRSVRPYREEHDQFVPVQDELPQEPSADAGSSSSPVRPSSSQTPGESSSSVRPPPFRVGRTNGLADADELSSSQSSLEDDDGIPF